MRPKSSLRGGRACAPGSDGPQSHFVPAHPPCVQNLNTVVCHCLLRVCPSRVDLHSSQHRESHEGFLDGSQAASALETARQPPGICRVWVAFPWKASVCSPSTSTSRAFTFPCASLSLHEWRVRLAPCVGQSSLERETTGERRRGKTLAHAMMEARESQDVQPQVSSLKTQKKPLF